MKVEVAHAARGEHQPRAVAAPRSTKVSQSKPNTAAASAGWNVLFTLWSSIISLVLTPWLIDSLGTGHYGIMLLMWSFTGVLGIMNLGLGEATLRFVAFHYGRNDLCAINRVIGSTLAIYLAISVVVSTSLVILAPVVAGMFAVAEEDRSLVITLVRLAAAIFALGIVGRAVGAIPAALQRYDITTKLNIAQSLLTFGGYTAFLALGLKVFYFIAWDVVVLGILLATHVAVAKHLLPGIVVWPRASRPALRELFGYSIYTFLGYLFYCFHRESAKLLVGGVLGPAGVSFLGVPDNLSQRVHGVVQSAGETLLPRFSAADDGSETAELFWTSTWLAACVAVTVFVPFVIVLPDFLRLWVGSEFAERSGHLGQLVALSYIAQSIFVPASTLARGNGKPAIVTFVVLLSGAIMFVAGIALIPRFGLDGAGFAYLAASIPSAAGTIYIASSYFRETACRGLFRVMLGPVFVGCLAFGIAAAGKNAVGTLNWAELIIMAMLTSMMTALMLLAVEESIGRQTSRSRLLLAKISLPVSIQMRRLRFPDARE